MATMEDMAMDTVLVMDMVDMVMDTMDTMARDPLMLRLSQDMVTMEDMAMDTVLVMDMVDMVMDTIMARDLLMLSQDMATTDMDMAMVMDMDMDTAMDMVMDTTDKQYKCFLLTV